MLMMKKRQLDKQKEVQEKVKIAKMQVGPSTHSFLLRQVTLNPAPCPSGH